MNFGPLDPRGLQCVGAIFDLALGTDLVSGGGNPSWVVGATFLVCRVPFLSSISF
jgi:cathepsin D